jgi:hypothetical protein
VIIQAKYWQVELNWANLKVDIYKDICLHI